MACTTSVVAPVSLMECMANCGAPTSIVCMPSLADMIGPMVDPQVESLRTTKS